MWIRLIIALLFGIVLAGWTNAQTDGVSPARLDIGKSEIVKEEAGLRVSLVFSAPVPFRVTHLQEPPRLVVDFTNGDLRGVDPSEISRSVHVVAGAAGPLSADCSRMVLQFDSPFLLERTKVEAMGEGIRANLWLRGGSTTELAKQAQTEAELAGGSTKNRPAQPVIHRQDGMRPLRVMLDPGHGGIDPGALSMGQVEAHLMLEFALELRDLLEGAGMDVLLTRDTDSYVSLESRVAMAQRANVDLFLSLHADALNEGEASGATVYTISEKASDKLSKLLVQRHNRGEILAGVDLTAQDDQIADVLTDLARQNTLPRADALADQIVKALQQSAGPMHKHPRLEASFSVLKAAEVPSVLLELGFLSNAEDLARLNDATWRAQSQKGILIALQRWAKEDAAIAEKLRR